VRTAQVLRLALWPLAVAGAAAVARAALVPIGAALPRTTRAARVAAQAGPQAYPADSLAAVVQAGDVFRLGHRPAPVRYDPAPQSVPAPSPTPTAARPALLLAGVLLGGEPAAVIEGLPGTDGARVLHVGQVVAHYLLREVSADRAVIVGPDTVWVLTLRRQFR